MITIEMTYTAHLLGDLTSGGIESHLDDVMSELEILGAYDVSISLDRSSGDVHVNFLLDGDVGEAVVQEAAAKMRTAIHAAHGQTPGWQQPDAGNTVQWGEVIFGGARPELANS